MARYTGSVCRLCRREGAKLFLKGDRCYSGKCSFLKRPLPPGMQAKSRRKKVSEYGLQLREKQKVKRAYGMLESQFEKYYGIAERMKGKTGENLLRLLESRLDNVVFRLGIGDSRAQARQFVLHGHILVNGKKVDIASFLVSEGDEITIRKKSADTDRFKELRESEARPMPSWLTMDNANLTGRVIAAPAREDIDLTIEEHLIVEYYSK
ncbi:MAG: 30S ribosomal protein S4 [Eubacteriales bacterium]|nr:30S ribosomal protein S4 [Eubacteriales bacterium]